MNNNLGTPPKNKNKIKLKKKKKKFFFITFLNNQLLL
jgi:hypothetical protein